MKVVKKASAPMLFSFVFFLILQQEVKHLTSLQVVRFSSCFQDALNSHQSVPQEEVKLS